MEIKKTHFRAPLAEGRNTGMGFGFLEKESDGLFKTLMPISSCKDYLNDALYAEIVGKKLGRIYGFSYDGPTTLLDGDYYYLGVSINGPKKLEKDHYFDSDHAERPNFEKDTIRVLKNRENLESFVNQIEKKIGLPKLTQIHETKNAEFIVFMPKFWGKKIYLLSLYTLLLRAYQSYDNSLPAIKYIEQGEAQTLDQGHIMSIKKKLETIFSGKLIKQSFDEYASSSSVHNYGGIVSVPFALED